MTPLLAQRPRAERAFERLYRRHVGDVYRYCLVVLRNRSDAEDVTQTTFMNAYRAFQGGERPRDAHRWLIAIAHNVCRQRFRQAQRRVEEVAYDDGIGDAFVPEDDVPSAEDLRRALDQLAFNQRAALVMRELEGRSYAEIAELLELSVSAVETLLFRARRALREQLDCTLTCEAAELAISRQLDGRLARSERGQLRAHLRRCKPCATLARRQRAQRAAIKALGAVPLPASLASFFGGGSAAAGGALAGAASGGAALKVAAVVAAAGVVTAGASYELGREPVRDAAAGSAKAAAAPAPATNRAPGGVAAATPRSFRAPDARPPARSRSTDSGRAAVASSAASAAPKDPAASPGGERPAKPAQARGGRPAVVPARAGKPARTAEPARARPARAAATPLTRSARPQQPARSTPARPTKTTPTKTRPAKTLPAKPRPSQAQPKPTPPAKPRPDDRPRPRPVVPPDEPPPGEEEGADPSG